MNTRKQTYEKPGGASPDKRTTAFDRLRKRTNEIAAMAGRGPLEIRQLDYEKAKRELTGESLPERQQAVLMSDTSL